MSRRVRISPLALFTLCIASACFYPVSAKNTADLQQTVLQVAIEQGMQHATISVCVYNTQNNRRLYSYNSEQSVIPASVNKIFTTGTGFARLGAHFRFVTRLSMRGYIDREGVLHGNLYIIGGGDPLLGSYRYRQTAADSLFENWTKSLKKRGVRRVDGRVCYITSLFDDQQVHDSWQWSDIGNYYGAGVSALNFHENMFFVYFNGDKKMGQQVSIASIKPKNANILALSEVTTAAANTGDNVVIYGSPYGKERLCTGTIPIGSSNFAVRGALASPAKCCADMFATYLRTHDINVHSTSTQTLTMPDSLQVVMDYYSTDYYTIAQYTNLTSNNVYAESILKYLGTLNNKQGSFASGVKEISSYFKDKKLEASGVRMVDGSGLSRLNRTTTDFICRYLNMITREDYYDDFVHTLAENGKSGTAKNILPHLGTSAHIFLKTGTLDGVRAYAGYVKKDDGNTYSFAVIINNHECSTAQVNEKMNRILAKLVAIK